MAVVTIYRLAEEIVKILNGGDIQAATNVSMNEAKIACGQVINQLLKTEYFNTTLPLDDRLPDGMAIATYEGIQPEEYTTGKSKAKLPVKPIKLPRNMGVFSVFRTADPSNEFIPLQMGHANLIKSQPLINDLLGHIGYENFGMDLIFTKDLLSLFPNPQDRELSMRLVIMDISQYDDYDPLPILPEHEWQVKWEVVKMYAGEDIADKLVDVSSKEQQKIPVTQQKQS